jgi:uncharacterized protein (DUF1684 family)
MKRRTMMWIGLASMVLAFADAPPPGAQAPDGDGYEESIRQWQRQREERLRSANGWLTIAGLYWLEPGEQSFGSGPGNDLLFPEGSVPAEAGVLVLEDDRVTLRVAPGVAASCNDTTMTERGLRADDSGPPDRVAIGRVTFWIIKRGARHGVRLRDPESPLLQGFTGLEFYPIDTRYRIVGRFVPMDPPQSLIVPNILGYSDTMSAYGRVAFEVNDTAYSLTPLMNSPADSNLSFVLSDATSGTETYGGGRFLIARLEEGGRVVLDFNKAYNPPCAYNHYTTCPLPPEGNDLEVALRAGEKDYAGKDH